MSSTYRTRENQKNDPHERHLGKHLAFAFRSYNTFIDQKIKSNNFELSRGQLLILFVLYKNPPLTQHQLSKMLYVDKAAVNRVVLKLEKKGFLVKKTSPYDKRKISLHLTPKAQNYQPVITAFLEEINQEIKEGFTGEEFETLLGLLKKFTNLLGFYSPHDKEVQDD